MRRIFTAAVVALTLWCSSALATTTTRDWQAISPGGGGDFTSADVSVHGRVIVTSDVGGMFARQGNSGNWTRIGYIDGLVATRIYSVKFSKSNPSHVVAGTANGVFCSDDTGQNWYGPVAINGTASDELKIACVAWGEPGTADSSTVAVGWNSDPGGSSGQANISLATSWSSGPSLGAPNASFTTNSSTAWRQPIKIVFDPSTGGSSRNLIVLMGCATTNCDKTKTKRELWLSMNGDATFHLMSGSVVIDAVFDKSGGAGKFYFTTSDDTDADTNGNGHVYRASFANDYSGNTYLQYAYDSGNCKMGAPGGGAAGCSPSDDTKPTGAIWYEAAATGTDTARVYMVTVSRDACGSTTSGAGVWRRTCGSTGTAGDTKWAQIDIGTTNTTLGTLAWENGWADCTRARGQTQNNVAQSISDGWTTSDTARDQYWATSRFLYWYDKTSGSRKWRQAYTDGNSSPWQGLRVDNANVTALFAEASTTPTVWVGFYDLGLWKYSIVAGIDTAWTNMNAVGDANWGWSSSGYGGNINGIYVEGTGSSATVWVTVAPSSKTNQWRLYRKIGTGSWAEVGIGNSYSDGHNYLRSFTKDPVTGYYWISRNGHLWYSSNGTTWNQVCEGTGGCQGEANGLPTDGGIMTVRAYNGTVVCGGWNGIWTTTNNNVNSWFHADDLVSGACTLSDVTSTSSCGGAGSGCLGTTSESQWHTESWHGIHDIFYNVTMGEWYATCYVASTSGACGNSNIRKGLLYSQDAANWSVKWQSRTVRRGVYADSCNGQRIHLTSASEFSSGPNDESHITRAQGCQTCRWKSGVVGDELICVPDVADDDRTDPLWRYAFGARITGWIDPNGSAEQLFVGACGNGVMTYWTDSGAGEYGLCGLQRPFGAARPVAEGDVPKLPRTLFSVAEARELAITGKLELYDVAGRKSKSPGAGVYFVVERNAAGVVTARRTVVVTP